MKSNWSAVHLRLVTVTRLEARTERESLYLFMAALFFLVLVGLAVADIYFNVALPYRPWLYGLTALLMLAFGLAYYFFTYGVLRIYDGNGWPLDIYANKKAIEDLDHTLASFLEGLNSRTS